MSGHVVRLLRGAFFAAAALTAIPASAQHPAPPGRFDYYLLALSWSPSFCQDHRHDPSARAECDRHRGFVAHGLWPQFADDSWPEYCRAVPPLSRALIDRSLAIMPNAALVEHEWERHGSCMTMSAEDYISAIERAFAEITVPPAFARPRRPLDLPAADVAGRFAAANPGLAANMLAVECKPGSDEVQEIRICLDTALHFRACGPRTVTSCKAGEARFPANP